jgi:SAM-dependent methyltransferase
MMPRPETMPELPAPDPMQRYFDGAALYGDDFDDQQRARWYESEREGYAGQVRARAEAYRYKYHALNRHYGYAHVVGDGPFEVLGLGSAFGDELLPLAPRARSFDIVEPSHLFAHNKAIAGVPTRYHDPDESGRLGFDSGRFDIVVSFGVLHHIANVTTVVNEIHRVLKPGGLFLCREPIVTQGDWRQPRRGLTKNERGIPHAIFLRTLRAAGFEVERASLFDFAPFVRLVDKLGMACFGSMALTRADRVLSRLFGFNRRYHRTRLHHKFGPASMFVVARSRRAATPSAAP